MEALFLVGNSFVIKLIFGIFYHYTDKMVHQYSKEKIYVTDGWSRVGHK
ncbi:hypothetical protein [Fusobacterium varium]